LTSKELDYNAFVGNHALFIVGSQLISSRRMSECLILSRMAQLSKMSVELTPPPTQQYFLSALAGKTWDYNTSRVSENYRSGGFPK